MRQRERPRKVSRERMRGRFIGLVLWLWWLLALEVVDAALLLIKRGAKSCGGCCGVEAFLYRFKYTYRRRLRMRM